MMEVDLTNTESEEREEGEIVEDEFEDVSDASMSPNSPLYFGKSVSPPEFMRAVCLSNVSDKDYKLRPSRVSSGRPYFYSDNGNVQHRSSEPVKRKRKSVEHASKSTRHYHTRHCRRSVDSSTDSEDDKVNHKYLQQLKEAVRRENSQDLSHKNLKARLKVMISSKVSADSSDDDQEITRLRNFALLSATKNATEQNVPDDKEISEDVKGQTESLVNAEEVHERVPEIPYIESNNNLNDKNIEVVAEVDKETSDSADHLDDTELIELRLAALKSAVLKKHQDRKKRKAMQSEREQSTDTESNAAEKSSSGHQEIFDNNKENTQDLINKSMETKQEQIEKVKDEIKHTSYSIAKDLVNEVVNNVVTNDNRSNTHCTDQDLKNLDMPIENDLLDVSNGYAEEDADILRAMLLASISKKITAKSVASDVAKDGNICQNSNNENLPLTKVIPATIRKISYNNANIYPSLNVTLIKPIIRTVKNNTNTKVNNRQIVRTLSNNVVPLTNRRFPSSTLIKSPVKPLIININAESDSDNENTKNTDLKETESDDRPDNVLKDTVSEFLKQQRAAVEKQNTNAADKNTLTAEFKSTKKVVDSVINKSVMRLLPHSQQIEYRKLKQQLLNARKKPKTRRLSQKLEIRRDSKTVATFLKKGVKKFENLTLNTSRVDPVAAKIQQDKKNVSSLKKTLDDLQIHKDGRLQMKGKYKSLGPLLLQVNQASMERRIDELEIKRLLQDLQKARTKLATSHQNFTKFVQQLLTKKDEIDKRELYNIRNNSLNKITSKNTSTPIKTASCDQSCDLSPINLKNNKYPNNLREDASLNKKNSVNNNGKLRNEIKTVVTQNVNENNAPGKDGNQNETISCNDEEKVILDPNDITKVFVQFPSTESVIPKYISPLDNCNRESVNNPLEELCPYDLLGICKDNECPYKHIL